MNNLRRADGDTFAAVSAFIDINNGNIVRHMDSIVFADLFTYLAGNTACFAEFSGYRAGIPRMAANENMIRFFDHGDEISGAAADTHGAARA